MAYHFDEKLQKYVIENEPTGTTSMDTTPKNKGNEQKQEAPGGGDRDLSPVEFRGFQYKNYRKIMEDKIGPLWWLWPFIGLGIIGNLVRYLIRLLDN